MLRSIKYGINGAVLAGLIATPVVLLTNADKAVHLVVDGKPSTVRTSASSVGQVLAAHGYRVNSHDLVAPSVKSHVENGSRIVLRRGRLLNLTVDGQPRRIWTTEPTVAQALSALGYSSAAFVSVSRSRRLPMGATDISLRTPHLVQIVHDGVTDQVTTTDPTVGVLLADLGIKLDADDRISAPLVAPLHDDAVIRLQRVEQKAVTETHTIKHGTTKRDDAKLTKGSTKVVTKGVDGKSAVTYALVYVDGKLTGKTQTGTKTLRSPRNEVLSIGTKKAPSKDDDGGSSGGSGSSSGGGSANSGGNDDSAPNTPSAPAPSPGSAKGIAKDLLAKRGWGDGQYDCLVQMWNRESGWRTHAANPSGAYGIPQALPGSKMSSAGPDWRNNATTQIKWGLGYISARYDTPCGAWSFWQNNGYY